MHPLAGHFMVAAIFLEAQRRRKARRTYVSQVQEAVAGHFEIKLSDMLSDRRAVHIARPRQIAMALCRDMTTSSLPDIGRRFGNRDHSTVIHACKRIAELRLIDEELDADYLVLQDRLTRASIPHT
jgi:chromosomal replication initiator protein